MRTALDRPKTAEPLLTKRELAELLGVSQSTVNRIPRDELPVTKIGSLCRYKQDHVRRYIDSRNCELATA